MCGDSEWGSGVFQVLIVDEVHSFRLWDALPPAYDELLAWKPTYPPGPRTADEQAWVESWPQRFQEALRRARRHPHR